MLSRLVIHEEGYAYVVCSTIEIVVRPQIELSGSVPTAEFTLSVILLRLIIAGKDEPIKTYVSGKVSDVKLVPRHRSGIFNVN